MLYLVKMTFFDLMFFIISRPAGALAEVTVDGNI